MPCFIVLKELPDVNCNALQFLRRHAVRTSLVVASGPRVFAISHDKCNALFLRCVAQHAVFRPHYAHQLVVVAVV